MKSIKHIDELDALQDLMTSDTWMILRNMMGMHVEYLRGKMEKSVRDQKDRQAGEYLARIDEVRAWPGMIKARITELKGQK